jgi:hypothetical protein
MLEEGNVEDVTGNQSNSNFTVRLEVEGCRVKNGECGIKSEE